MLVLSPASDDDAGSHLWSAFCGLATLMGDYQAILAPGRDSLTFRDLRDQIAATRNTLNRWGIGRGDRVVVVLPNGPEMAVCFLAITASAVFTPFNPAYTEDEFRRYIARLQPKLLIVPSDSEATARMAAASLGVTTIDLVVEENRPAGCFTLRGGIEGSCADPGWNTINDVALILHTSGTTAQQKLVPLKQRHLLAYVRGINRFYRLDSTDRCLTLNPMFHGAGLKGGLLVPLINGSAVVCPPEGVDSFFKYLDVYRPTWYTAGYTIQNAILREAEAHCSIVEESRLRFIRCGTGRLDPKVQRGLETIFRAPVIQQYSASEASGITCNPFPPAVRKPGSAGIPVINEVAIMDSNGSFLPTGEEGEIVVRGPSVFDGYLNDPEANEAAFVNGWFRTGDLGRFDADGFLMISGRISDQINRGGEKILPAEVEAVLAEHGAVGEVKVFGIPHASLGEEVVAAVVLSDGASATDAELKRFAARRLSHFKVPRRIFFLESFPLGLTNKVDTKALVRACESLRASESVGTVSGQDVAGSSVETRVAGLWREILDCEGITTGEGFFIRGGDSLRAVELLLLVKSEFGVDLPVNTIYEEASTIAGMAGTIERQLASTIGETTSSHAEVDRVSRPPWESSPRTQSAEHPAVTLGDLVTALTLLGLAPVAWLLPRKAWLSISKWCARAHIVVRGSRAQRLEIAVSNLDVSVSAKELELRFLSGVYEDTIMTLRELWPRDWQPEIRLHGKEHLQAALDAGRGAVLWSCPFIFSGLIYKKAIKDAGLPLVSLRSHVHPYSGSRFGMSVLNPVRTRVEDRYLEDPVLLFEGRGGSAFQELGKHLDKNRLVVIAANGSEGAPLAIPFLGGTLKLALGAPTLALLHDVPLLPLFAVPDDAGGFDVTIEPPIGSGSNRATSCKASEMTRCYAQLLETYAKRYPTVWRSWFTQNTWSPYPNELDVGGVRQGLSRSRLHNLR